MLGEQAADVRWRVGLGLGIVWAAFWIWFGLACGWSEGGWREALVHALLPGGVFALLVYFAWLYPRGGSWGLIAVGLAITVAYPLWYGRHFPFSTVVFIWLTMAWPPILAGILLLGGRRVEL